MDEMRIVVDNYTLSNPELTARMNIIKDSIRDIAKNGLTIGQQLKEIKDGELWKDDFKDFVECAGQFGIKKAQAYNMIKSYEMAKKYELEDFTPTALIEIGRLDSKKGEKVVKKALEGGQIKQSMAVSDLRKFVDKKLGKTDKLLTTKNQKAVETQEAETQEAETKDLSPVGITPKDSKVVDLLTVVSDESGISIITDYPITDKERDTILKIVGKYVDEK